MHDDEPALGDRGPIESVGVTRRQPTLPVSESRDLQGDASYLSTELPGGAPSA